MVRIAIFLPLALDVSSVKVDQDAYEYDSERDTILLLDLDIHTDLQTAVQTYTMQIVIVLAILVLVGFSQVLLPLLSLHVAVEAEESEVPEEPRPITRLGAISQALFTSCSSDTTNTLLPILGTRGPIDISLLRANIPSMLTVDMEPTPRTFHGRRVPASVCIRV